MPNNKATRTAAGSGSIRQRPDGRWEARLTLGYDEGKGKRKTLSIYGATQKEVKKKMTEKLRQLDTNTYIADDQLANHLLHLLCRKVTQPHRTQIRLQVVLDDASISRDSIWLLRWNNKFSKPCIEILRKRPFVIGYIGICIQLAQLLRHLLFHFFLRCTVYT